MDPHQPVMEARRGLVDRRHLGRDLRPGVLQQLPHLLGDARRWAVVETTFD
jgi:hypothetical protein